MCLQLKTGEIIGLLGPNGAGKTTSFYMITGLVRPDSGFIYLDKKDISRFGMFSDQEWELLFARSFCFQAFNSWENIWNFEFYELSSEVVINELMNNG